MSSDILMLLIPILALAIPVAAVVSHGMQRVARMRLEQARAEADAHGQSASHDIETLRAEVAQLRQDLSDVEERLDFTERALTQDRDLPRLPP